VKRGLLATALLSTLALPAPAAESIPGPIHTRVVSVYDGDGQSDCTGDYYRRHEIFRELLSACETLATNGDVAAQRTLGMLLEEGSRDWHPDYEKAAMWFRKAANEGDARAQWWLSTLYMDGIDVIQDSAEARRWLQKAAEQSQEFAWWDLGKMYREGTGVPKDLVQAHKWLNLTAGAGYPVAAEQRDTLAKTMSTEQILEAQRLAREWQEAHQ
jgi:TPR repeat protein